MKHIILSIGAFLFLFKRKMFSGTPKTILVLKIGAIGDVLMSTPLLHALRNAYPHARIIYAVGKWSKAVLENNPNVDEVMDFDDPIIWRRDLKAILVLIRRLRSVHADIGFVLDRHFYASLLAVASGVRFRVGYDRNGEGFANNRNVVYGPVKHEIVYHLDLLRSLGKDVPDGVMEAFPSTEDQGIAESIFAQPPFAGRTCIGFMVGGAKNPGQDMHIRRWPFSHYCALIGLLLEHFPNIVIILFGGPSDVIENKEVIRSVGHADHIAQLAGRTSILQSIACMKRCAVFVTHDSGPMHMAATAGVPVVSIFGPVHPARKAPRGPQNEYLWRPDLPGALCDEEGRFPKDIKELKCMTGVTPKDVLLVVKKHLSTTSMVQNHFNNPL